MLNTEETIDRLNRLWLEDNINEDYINRIRNQQHLLLEIVDNSPLVDTIDIEKINIVYNQVVLSVQAFLRGNIQESIAHIREFILKGGRFNYIYIRQKRINKHNLIAYRARNSETYDIFTHAEMMHIPDHKRHLIRNQRYSLSGYPCLYLGASIYGCWEELERPNIDKFNITCMRNEKLIHLIDLTLPHFSCSNLNANYIYASILPLLCSFRTKHKGCAFIEEYIVPQILMSILINHFMRGISVIHDIIAYQGIMYTSTILNTSKGLYKDRKLMTNYVFPILGKKINTYGLCEYICEYFSLTEPTSLTNERVITEQGNIIMYEGEKEVSKYEMTEFGKLEEKMKARNFQRI